MFWRYVLSESPDESDLAVLESKLKGKTLLVYWHLLQQPTETVGVRQVQRALGFSSPSVAAYHLGKLEDLALVRKNMIGEYVLKEEVEVGILRFFTRLGHFLVPRYLFYSVLFSTMITTYLFMCALGQIAPSFYGVLFGLVASFIFWFETVRLWRTKPF